MELADDLHHLFHADIEKRQDSYVVEVPQSEVTNGALYHDAVYRVAVLSTVTPTDDASADMQSTNHVQATQPDEPRPPVVEGEQRTVEMEDIGDQGDGIARVDRGYVIIVPDTEGRAGDRRNY